MANPLPSGLPEEAPVIALLLCRTCASLSRAELGKGVMTCPCGGDRRLLRLFQDQREDDEPVRVDRRS
jgi:hypothetical protein